MNETIREMKPTTEELKSLTILFALGSTGYPDFDDYELLGEDEIVCTRDTLDNFRDSARKDWREAEGQKELEGGIYWDRVQISKGDERVHLAVFDCGDFRISYKK